MAAQRSNGDTRPEYPCNGKYRGRALIIVNDTFEHLEDRKGAKYDAKMMKKLFSMLDFKITLYRNLTTEEMKEKIEKAALDEKNCESDCFVLVISSHGLEFKRTDKGDGCSKEAIVWISGVCGSNGALGVDDILSNFEENKSVGLAGKPKLFFIQACRSRENAKTHRVDHGSLVKIRNTKSKDGKGDRYKSGDKRKMDCRLKLDSTRIDFGTRQDDTCKNRQHQLVDNDQHQPAGPPTPNKDNPPDSSSPKRPHIEDTYEFCKDYEDIYKDWTDSGDDSDVSESEEASSNIVIDTKPGPDDSDLLPLPFESVPTIRTKVDAKPGPCNQEIRPQPFELVPTICPKDCLVAYSTISGKFAFHADEFGSYMFYHMYKHKNILVKGKGLLNYLTQVTSAMAKDEIFCESEDLNEEEIKNLPFKHCACISHRLTSDVRLKPKTTKTLMAIVNKWLGN